MSQNEVLIVGAGIAGLTTALALAKRGQTVQLFEQAAVLSEVGAGLQLSPNAVSVLHALGLEAALQEVAFQPQAIEAGNGRTGRVLASEPLGEAAIEHWGAPYYHIHRADLQQLLLAQVRSNPAIRLHLNAPCQAVGQDAQSAWLKLADGEMVRGDVLLGADGIHSIVRASCFDTEPPRFTGNVAWRLLIPSNALPAELIRPTASLWMGPGAHFVHYYVRGGDYVNCVCVVEQQGWEEESWTAKGDKAELVQAFAGWHDGIQQLIAAADPDSCYRWALYDRDPMPSFTDQRIALLGDAAHPTLPFLAQGAAMAIEDAAVLARSVYGSRELLRALANYENQRRERITRVVLTSRRNGRVYHWRGIPALLRNFVMWSGYARLSNRLEWLYSARLEI